MRLAADFESSGLPALRSIAHYRIYRLDHSDRITADTPSIAGRDCTMRGKIGEAVPINHGTGINRPLVELSW
jgi:hypothetical protein